MKQTLYRLVHRSGQSELPCEFKTIAIAKQLLKDRPGDWRIDQVQVHVAPFDPVHDRMMAAWYEEKDRAGISTGD